MSATVISAIVSTVTTAMLAYIAAIIRKAVKSFGAFRKEHEFLMRTTPQNTLYIARIMKHLEMIDDGSGTS